MRLCCRARVDDMLVRLTEGTREVAAAGIALLWVLGHRLLHNGVNGGEVAAHRA